MNSNQDWVPNMNAAKHDPSHQSISSSNVNAPSQASSRLPPSILGRAFAGILADELNAAAQASRLAGDGPIEPSRAHLHVLFGTDEQCSVKDALNNGDFRDDV